MVFSMLPLTPLVLNLTERARKEESKVKWPYRGDLKKKRPRKEEPTLTGPRKEFTLRKIFGKPTPLVYNKLINKSNV